MNVITQMVPIYNNNAITQLTPTTNGTIITQITPTMNGISQIIPTPIDATISLIISTTNGIITTDILSGIIETTTYLTNPTTIIPPISSTIDGIIMTQITRTQTEILLTHVIPTMRGIRDITLITMIYQ